MSNVLPRFFRFTVYVPYVYCNLLQLWCTLCRIPASKIALNKSQLDAMLARASRGSSGTAELIPEAVEAHAEPVQAIEAELVEAAESNSHAAEGVSAVVSPQMQACLATTQTDVTMAVSGLQECALNLS